MRKLIIFRPQLNAFHCYYRKFNGVKIEELIDNGYARINKKYAGIRIEDY